MYRKLQLKTLVLALLFLLVLPVLGWAAPTSDSAIVRFDILSINDFHGALIATGKNPGAAALAGYLLREKEANPQGTLILSAGDMFQGSMDSNLLQGKTVVSVMNAVGFDAMCLGNHEFDWGLPVLKARMAEASFPMLAANIVDKATGQPVDFIKGYTIVEKQGVKIAVIGIITPETAITTNPRTVAGYNFADPAATLAKLVPELKHQGADIVIVLSHLASEMAEDHPVGDAADLAVNVKGVDVIISGHSHQKVAGTVNGVPVVQAMSFGRAVGKVSLVYSKTSRQVIAATATVAELPANGLRQDPAAKNIIDRAQLAVAPVKNAVIATTVRPLLHDRNILSPLGQWTADAMRAAAGTDVALQNGGGLRTGIAAGPVTMGQLYEVIPFDNTLYRVEMTGAQLLAALEHGLSNDKYGMVQFSGLRVKYDKTRPAGHRVLAVTLQDGSQIADDKTYSIATNDFMAAGGDGFIMIKAAAVITDTFIPLRDVLADALKKAVRLDFQPDDRLSGALGHQNLLIAA